MKSSTLFALVIFFTCCHGRRDRLVQIKRSAIQRMADDHMSREAAISLFQIGKLSGDSMQASASRSFMDSIKMQELVDSCKDELEK